MSRLFFRALADARTKNLNRAPQPAELETQLETQRHG
jgi:hypothetical protein